MLPAWFSVLLVWILVILQTRYQWGNESYYNFGFYVPLLFLYLLYNQFKGLQPLKFLHRRSLWSAALVLLPLIPAYAFSEVNPYWRAPLWIGGFAAFAFSLLIAFATFGKRGALKALFPFFFLLTMIPWPWRIEIQIITSLTNIVTDGTKAILHLIGYPVVITGNAFMLGDISIGVNEACSGIRSFQALFMVALFLGSVFAQTTVQRLLALVALPLVVIAVNSARATFLAVVVIENGDQAYNKWHDPAGYVAFVVSMLLIYGLIEAFGMLPRFGKQPTASTSPEPQPTFPAWLSRDLLTLRANLPAWLCLCIPITLAASTEAWFQFKEARAAPAPSWSIAIPPESDALRHFEIDPIIVDTLGYSYGHRFIQRVSNRSFLETYFYGYTPENKVGSASSYRHKPTICMENIGARLIEELPDLVIDIDDLSIPFAHYVFETKTGDDHIHVFWVVWENRNMGVDHSVLNDLNYQMQWVQLIRGRRDFSRQVLLSSVYGNVSPDAARALFAKNLSQWIVLDSPAH